MIQAEINCILKALVREIIDIIIIIIIISINLLLLRLSIVRKPTSRIHEVIWFVPPFSLKVKNLPRLFFKILQSSQITPFVINLL